MPAASGVLYVVATPIGNLADISARAVATLQQVAFILAEDTRRSGRLLKRLGIATPMRPFHEHNERQRTAAVTRRLRQGDDVALICDAGTPLLSDPGRLLVRCAHAEQLKVSVIPGPCALVAALSVAGMAAGRFVFEGFLPDGVAARQAALQALRQETRTMIFYVAPHDVVAFIAMAGEAFGRQREALLARELTKQFEQLKKSDLAGLAAWLAASPNHQRGEFVLVVAGAAAMRTATDELRRIIGLLPESLFLRDVVRVTCAITGASKNEVYDLALSARGQTDNQASSPAGEQADNHQFD